MKRAMVDIETLGTTNFATILQIGACDVEDIDNFIEINVEWDAEVQGRTTDIATVLWWGQQEKYVRDAVMFPDNQVPLVTALLQLEKWYRDNEFKEIWSQGSFDVNILENAMRQFGHAIPWNFWQTRDLRTVLAWLQQYEISPGTGKGNHTAVADARHQADRLKEVEKLVRKI